MIFQKGDMFSSKEGNVLKIIEVNEKGIRFRLNGTRITLFNSNWKDINNFLKNDAKKLTKIQYDEMVNDYFNLIDKNSDISLERVD